MVCKYLGLFGHVETRFHCRSIPFTRRNMASLDIVYSMALDMFWGLYLHIHLSYIYIIYINMLNDKKVRQQWDVRLVISLSCLRPLHHFPSHFFIANQIVLQNISPPGQEMGQALVSNTADNAKNLSYSYCLERKIY